MFVPYASEIWTKFYDPNYTNFWAFWQNPGFLKPFSTKRWRHFWRRFCSWNNCLILSYSFLDYYLSVFQKYGSPTRVTRLNVAINMADPISINACVKGHLEPTHLKSSPLFTFSTKLLGQDSPSIHLFSKIIGSRFTTPKIKLGEDSPSRFVFSRSRFAFKQRKW